jgi:hypothetical protein
MNLYHYLIAGGGAVTILSLMCYFAAGSRASSPGVKIPAVIGGSVGGLAAGLGVGLLIMTGFGWRLEPQKGGTPPGGPPGMPGGPPGMKGPPGFPGMPETPKAQLAALVEKLDRLTGKPLRLTLSDKEKAEVREQLQGLADKKEVSDDEAAKRLGNLIKALKPHKEALVAAGYSWPGDAAPSQASPNPFQEEATQAHLKALERRLGKKGADE